MPNYYQPEIETMPYEDLRKLQNERFMKQLRHVWDNVPYYRNKMEAQGVTIDDIHSMDDLHKPCLILVRDRVDSSGWCISDEVHREGFSVGVVKALKELEQRCSKQP